MTRFSPCWCLLFALGGLACGPTTKPFGPPQDADTSGIDTSAGGGGAAGGGGGTTSAGGTAGTGGGTGGSGGIPGNPGCMELGLIPDPGQMGPVPSMCTCQDEVEHILGIVAPIAKLHFDTFGDSCDTAQAVPQAIPAQTFYVTQAADGMDFHTGDPNTGWVCINANWPKLVHCKYSYTRGDDPITKAAGGPALSGNPQSFELVAQGDKDGDGKIATFAILGEANGGGGGVLVLSELLKFNVSE